MFGGIPPPRIPQPPPSMDAGAVIAASEDQRRRLAEARGRSSTVLTSLADRVSPDRKGVAFATRTVLGG